MEDIWIHTCLCTLDFFFYSSVDVAESFSTILWRNQAGVQIHLSESVAEMHLCNPLLKGETCEASCLILRSVLLQRNQIVVALFKLTRCIAKLCYLTAEKPKMFWILIYFFLSSCVFLCIREGNIFINLNTRRPSCIRKWFSSSLFCVVLIPISLCNLLLCPERRNSSLLFFSPL